MSRMKDLMIDVQNAIYEGKMTFRQIADYYGLPYDDVNLVAQEMMEQSIWEVYY
jgi:hypothetical protein